MIVALISERGVRLVEVMGLEDEILVPVLAPMAMYWSNTTTTGTLPIPVYEYRRFVRQDEHTYVEKD